MIFNSFDFFWFFPLTVSIYFLVPQRFRVIWLLAASCFFYMSFIPYYVLFLFFLILVDYFAAIAIEKNRFHKSRRKYILLASITSNIGMLFIFKYFNYFDTNIGAIANFFHINYPIHIINLILPIGISFHTFQSLGYVIDVYLRRQKAERKILVYALFVMFFPQLAAGPIERAQHMLKQFKTNHAFDEKQATIGLERMIFGLFKKVVVADRLAILVNQIYAQPKDYIGFPLAIATFAFAIQIYCDFSGYTDIAIGAAKVMGFNLVENFNLPYLAKSIPEFWRRWHMSLYNWFRDYVYIPLGGNRKGKVKQIVNIFIVFGLTGLWHGANWTFVFWGLLHGLYMAISQLVTPLGKFILNPLKVTVTFVLVCGGWILFRAKTLNDAIYIYTHLGKGWGSLITSLFTDKSAAYAYIFKQGSGLGLNISELKLAGFTILVLILVEILMKNQFLNSKPGWMKFGLYTCLTLCILNFSSGYNAPFIYFQF
jgi:alginate O-acetyltransferase complex protein AlgI